MKALIEAFLNGNFTIGQNNKFDGERTRHFLNTTHPKEEFCLRGIGEKLLEQQDSQSCWAGVNSIMVGLWLPVTLIRRSAEKGVSSPAQL